MKTILTLLGIKAARELRWSDYAVLAYFGISILALAIDVDRTPIHLTLGAYINLAFAAWLASKTLPALSCTDPEEDEAV